TPRSHASGYIAAIAITDSTAVVTTYIATAPSAVVPSRSASGTASANTPYGASDRTPRTPMSLTALIGSAARSSHARCAAGSRAAAAAKISVTTMSGSMAPADIAATRLFGMSPTSQSRNDGTASWGAVLAARSATAAPGSSVSRANTVGATTSVSV